MSRESLIDAYVSALPFAAVAIVLTAGPPAWRIEHQVNV
jgi:hypothetical protein